MKQTKALSSQIRWGGGGSEEKNINNPYRSCFIGYEFYV
jgi:hypothetical protein